MHIWRGSTSGSNESTSAISQLETLLARDYSTVALIRVDQQAMVPTRPIKPRKMLILAAAIVAGEMLD